MANDQDQNTGIANAKRYAEVLKMADENSRGILRGSTDVHKITRELVDHLHFSEDSAVEIAGLKADYDTYQNAIPAPEAPQKREISTKQNAPVVAKGTLETAAATATLPLMSIPIHKKDPAKYAEEDLEKEANKYAQKNTSIFIRDKAKRAAALDARRGEFYRQYASDPRYREHARQLAQTSQNQFLHKAIEKDNEVLRTQLNQEARNVARKQVIANRVLRSGTSDREVATTAIQQSYTRSYTRLLTKNPLTAQGLATNTTNGPLLRAVKSKQKPGLPMPSRSKNPLPNPVSILRRRAIGMVFGMVITSIFGAVFLIVLIGGPGVAGYSGETGGGGPTTQTPNEVIYCQGRESWSSQSYDSGTIASTGCAPTSMAMILSSYGGVKYDPGQVATMFHNNHWDFLPGSGDRGTNLWRVTKTWLNSLGFQGAKAYIVNNDGSGTILNDSTVNLIKNYLDNGWLLLTAVNGFDLPTVVKGPHAVVIEGINSTTSTITIRDPNSSNCRSGKTVTFNYTKTRWYLIWPIKPK